MNRLPTFRLAGLELRRFLRGRLTTAALVVLAVIPLLYGALYLYAFWDPYGRLNHIPAALVMQDRPAKAGDGSTVHAGQELADELVDREVFDWHVTDENDAREGLESGRYHLVLRVPADFSAKLAAGPDPDREPQVAQLLVFSDDATNYLSGQFARTAFEQVRAAAAATASTDYFNKMLVGFTDLKQQTQEAADGADKLRGGTSDAAAGADELSGGLSDASTGADRLSGGLSDASTGADRLSGGLHAATRGADDLADGLVTIRSGAARLASSTQQAAGVGRQLATVVDTAADKAGPILRDNADLLQRSANRIADGADTLADALGTLPTLADTTVQRAEAIRDRLDALVAAHPELADDPAVLAARRAADEAVTAAKQLRSRLDGLDLDTLQADMHRVAATARKVAEAAPHLADDLAAARTKVDQFADGLGQIAVAAGQLRAGTADAASGAADLSGGLARLSSGATDLRGGIFELASGSRRLDGGLSTLSGGGRELASGMGQLESGAAQLAAGLADGAEQIPGYGDDPSARAAMLGEPVSLNRSVQHPAATYGVAFAPYFLALALWVGAMISFMVLRPLNRRHVMSGAPAPRVALAGLLPAVAVGLTQTTILFCVVTFGLGLSPVHPVKTLGLLMLTATAFAAIIQLLGAALGAAGRIAALALLMLQLTSSGGTYPVQTTPEFFQGAHPLLPMTYVVRALRHTIDGGPGGTVTSGALALLGFGAAAFLLTVAVARKSRRLTQAKLHPELVI